MNPDEDPVVRVREKEPLPLTREFIQTCACRTCIHLSKLIDQAGKIAGAFF